MTTEQIKQLNCDQKPHKLVPMRVLIFVGLVVVLILDAYSFLILFNFKNFAQLFLDSVLIYLIAAHFDLAYKDKIVVKKELIWNKLFK